MLNKRFVCMFFSIIIFSLSIYFSYPHFVSAANNSYKFNWNTLDADQWGQGKSYDECTDEEKTYRDRQITACYFNETFRSALQLLNVVPHDGGGTGGAITGFYDGLMQMLQTRNAIKEGATTYSEYLGRKAGLGYLYDKAYGDDMPDPNNVDLTFSPELLNYMQDYIKQVNDQNSDIVNMDVLNVNDIRWFCGDARWFLNYANYESVNSVDRGRHVLQQNFVKSKLKYQWIVIKTPMSIQYNQWLVNGESINYPNATPTNNAFGVNQSCYVWIEAHMSDFVWYLTSDVFSIPDARQHTYKTASARIERKDKQPFTIKYAPFAVTDFRDPSNTSYGAMVDPIEKQVSYLDMQYTFPANMYMAPTGLFYNGNTFGYYRSAGHLSSAMSYGPSLPTYIQPSSSMDKLFDSPMTINSGDVINYDYSTVINNIGDTTGMNPEELQQRIDEVLTEMGAISGNTQDIKENTELQVSWLRKIYDKLCDVYDKIGGGLSTGQFLEWEWLQVKLDAIIALLGVQTVSDWFDDATDLVSDVTDIGTDIGDAIVLKFPFCLPWDMMLILNALKSIPETPVFEIPVDIDSWNLHETITLDLSDFQILSDVAKWFFDVLYGFAITKLTLKILQVEIVGTSG